MILGIIQARMGSTRLPGKVLKEVEGKPLLQHMIERVTKSKLVDEFVVATSLKEKDMEIENRCHQLNVRCFRGSEDDVLDRFYQCAKSFEPVPEYIVRLTADCPLHDPKVIDFVVRNFLEKKVDFMTNSFEPLYEDGFDVEIFTFSALEDAWKNATKKSEREHVTPYIRNTNSFKNYKQKYCSSYNYKLSVDTISDFELIEQIFANLYAPKTDKMFGLNEVVSLLENNPSLLTKVHRYT
ncbi:MAG: glycosyltransferase family protein [Halobacteriota archaeon]